ncbi:hypothetical protein HK100_000188 [Physocladia obscura]|uniref:Ser-Thr-rich glycosyl-phosphatidyl-inositol-anchored membrane family-domain-containing protein n=1 Tax=Physocladia obscura TaxID=109957 RepID=A0AAD5SYQ2_9FUNG|nr:hypothetical protein HK100_000188 [Physocladia obscura]
MKPASILLAFSGNVFAAITAVHNIAGIKEGNVVNIAVLNNTTATVSTNTVATTGIIAIATSSTASTGAGSTSATTHVSSTAASGSGVSIAGTGAYISIIQPVQGQVLTVGNNFQITWNIGGTFDAIFNNGSLSFEIDNFVNVNNVALATNGALSFTTQPVVSDLQVQTTLPNIASGSSYTVRATYRDSENGNNYIYWFSPTFTITGGGTTTASTAHVSASSSSSSLVLSTAVSSRKKPSISVFIWCKT